MKKEKISKMKDSPYVLSLPRGNPPLYIDKKACYNDKEFQKGNDEIWKITLKNAR